MLDSTDRERGRECLALFIEHSSNVQVLEKNIHDNYGESLADYNNCIFDVIQAIAEGMSLKVIQGLVKSNELSEKNSIYQDLLQKQKEEDDFINNPYQVVEGVLTCGKCGSKRTISFNKQNRSGDEPTAVFAKCVNCKASWVYSG